MCATSSGQRRQRPGQEDIGKAPEGEHIMKEMILMPWRRFRNRLQESAEASTARVSDRSRSRRRKPNRNSTSECPQEGVKTKDVMKPRRRTRAICREQGQETHGPMRPDVRGPWQRCIKEWKPVWLGGQHELWSRKWRGLGGRKAREGSARGLGWYPTAT